MVPLIKGKDDYNGFKNKIKNTKDLNNVHRF